MTGAEGAEAANAREPLREIDGHTLLAGLRSSLAWLQANQEQVNELNVFPVPDGDTGSNMYLTMGRRSRTPRRPRSSPPPPR